jgi:hypothetical protein
MYTMYFRRKYTKILMVAMAGILPCARSNASTIAGTVTHITNSQPQLDSTDSAWASFSTSQGQPAASKGIVVQFVPDDGQQTGFPLDISSASVKLTRTPTDAEITCTASPTVPVLDGTNGGKCFYRVLGASSDSVQIFFLGLFEKNKAIRYRISGVKPSLPAQNTVQDFDSNSVIPGTPPVPTTGRKPARLVFVLDKSGSMAWSARPKDPGCDGFDDPPLPACQPARWQILNTAMAQVVGVASAYAITGDMFGVSLFDTTASTLTSTTDMNSGTLQSAMTGLNTKSPGGSTSIGAGVQNLNVLGSDNGDFNNVMLIFTDGDQNTPPYLESDTIAKKLKINPTTDSLTGSGISDFIPSGKQLDVCPFALRADNPAGPLGTSYLKDIADIGCHGLVNSSIGLDPQPPDLIQYFLQVLNSALIGDKLELVAVEKGTHLFSAGPSVEQTFTISKQDAAFTVLLNWNPAANGPQNLKLSKDGVDFSIGQAPTFAQIDRGRDHIAITLRAPYCNDTNSCVHPDGTWTLHFEPIAEVGKQVDYNVFVIGDNRTLASSFSVSQATAGVGEPLVLKAELNEKGAPLGGLASGSVRAFVAGPSAGLGNVLSASTLSPVAGSSKDKISGAGLKVAAMLADPTQRATILNALQEGADTGIVMAESGAGTYVASFSGTLAEGIYKVSFRVSGSSPDNGAFTRVYRTDYYVGVVPDPNATIATASMVTLPACSAPGGCVAITLKPLDAQGNLLGPGKAPIFGVANFNGQLLGPVKDNLDGSYTIEVGYQTAGSTPPIIQIGATSIPLAAVPGAKGGFNWWWILLLIFLLLIVILILRRLI